MAWRLMPLLLGALQAVGSPVPAMGSPVPAVTLQDMEVEGDTMSVGSYVREVRAAAPPDYHKSFENEGDGEIGYSRKKQGGGKKGYQHFDSYHKAAGDDYEFEKADSFGHDEDEEKGAHSHPEEARAPAPRHRKNKKTSRRSKRHPEVDEESSEGAYGRYEQSSASAEHDDDSPKKNKKNKRPEEDENGPHYEELKEGANDGNGRVEAVGHDPKDYVLPEKYTWEPEEF